MLQAVPNKLPLATIGEYLRDPAAYDPVAAFERALARYGREVVEALGRPEPNVRPPRDIAELVHVLAPGVEAARASALLREFV